MGPSATESSGGSVFPTTTSPAPSRRRARHHVDLVAPAGEVERQVREDLAGGGGVRMEEAVEEDDLHRRSTRRSPRTRQSMWVRMKQSSACAGVQTMGSLSLNEVLRSIGMPV